MSSEDLVALDMYSCFYGSAGVETCLFMSAILVNEDNAAAFVDAIAEKSKESNRVANPSDWNGGIHSSCYITPKEVCWFPWKSRYNPANVEEFPQFKLDAAVDACCYNSPEYGDVYFYLPSAPLRSILEITDSDGYLFFDKERRCIAEQSVAGEKWRTYQKYLVVNSSCLFEKMKSVGKTLVWVMMERRMNTGNTQEKFGKFGADRLKSCVGFFDSGKFTVKEIHTEFWSARDERELL